MSEKLTFSQVYHEVRDAINNDATWIVEGLRTAMKANHNQISNEAVLAAYDRVLNDEEYMWHLAGNIVWELADRVAEAYLRQEALND